LTWRIRLPIMAEKAMKSDVPNHDMIDGLRTRIQAEIDAQLSALGESHGLALEQARVDAARAADKRWAARLEATRAEWSARLASEIESVQAEAQQRLVAESIRVRLDAEHAAAVEARERLAHALAEERQHASQAIEAERAAAQVAIDAERVLAQAELEAQRVNARAELDQARERAEAAVAEARRALEAERRSSQAWLDRAPGMDATRLLEAIAALDAADTLSGVLAITAAAAAVEAPRAALFVINGSRLEEWQLPLVAALSHESIRTDAAAAGILGQAVRSAAAVKAGEGFTAPEFAALEVGRRALAVPLALGGQVVGVLYSDEGTAEAAPAGWTDAVEILGRHASARLAYLTAIRTAQALRLMRDGNPRAPDSPRERSDDEQGARRYARLLISEIKLYNEAAVRVGREKRDLLHRLEPEIDRARRLYDERITSSLAGRETFFQQELVQTLADGDAALLG
jgi:hypothetical protein